jgi:2'-5' RNA ligase
MLPDMNGRFGVWLMPEAGVAEELRTLIAGLALEYGGVAFEPHVTLLGGIHGDAASLGVPLASLAAQCGTMTVRLGGIGHRPEYFRCLYIEIEPDPALDRARTLTRSLFQHTPAGVFEPHISLLYGDMPEALKAGIAARLCHRAPRTLRLERVALYDLNGSPDAWSETDAAPLR